MKNNALEFNQGKYKYYLTSMSSKELFDISFISRRAENKDAGFQRLLNKARAKMITKYIEQGGTIPSPIITSLQPNIIYKYEKNMLSFYSEENSLMVLDGQHRLYGMNDLENQIQVPVVIFVGLEVDEEAKLFIDINTNQKGVPTALLLDIKKIAKMESDIESRQSKLFEYLNLEGPLAGNLLSSDSRRGGISRVAFNESTKKIFEVGVLSEESDSTIQRAVQNYLIAVNEVLREANHENASLTRTNTFRAVFGIFDEVINKTLSVEGNAKVESFYNTIQLIAGIDFSKYSGTNRQAQRELEEELRKHLHKNAINKFSSEELF